MKPPRMVEEMDLIQVRYSHGMPGASAYLCGRRLIVRLQALPSSRRRTFSAILWRHQNGAKRRAVPEELGP